jgi:hypothetical protein
MIDAASIVPANNGNFSWWGAFAKNLFSLKNFTAEFKQGGCVNVFGSATASALNPFSPSLSSPGEGTAAVLAASQYNAAVQYAASAPNYLGGTGLIYPMKSSVVRSMVADANATAASGGLMSLDLALAQGFGTETYSWLLETLIESRERDTEPDAPADQIGKNQRVAALCGNCRPDRDLGLDVCYAPSQDGRLPEPASEMARVCRNDRNRLWLRHPSVSAVVGKTEVLGAPGSILRRTFRPGSVCSSESPSCAFGPLRGADRH